MIQIRQGIRSDLEVIVGFQLAMARETESLELDRPTVMKGVQAIFDDPAKGTYWVATQERLIIGCLLVIPEWSDWRNGMIWWVHSVYVSPEHRRRGVFRMMYDHLAQQVRTRGDLRGLRLYVEKANHVAQRVYAELGMTDEHYAMYEWLK